MDIAKKFKETVISVLPITLIVTLLHLTIAPLGRAVFITFLAGCVLLILGLTLFLLGIDIGIIPLGENLGTALTGKRNVVLLLGVAFVIGFIVTAAEPAVGVFAGQVHDIDNSVSRTSLLSVISTGVGCFVSFGLMRIILGIPLKFVFIIGYVIIFALVFFVPDIFTGVAFDAGGATTGAVTVPFIMAFGLGVSNVGRRKSEDGKEQNSSFGLTGVASIGPIMAVLIYSIFHKSSTGGGSIDVTSAISHSGLIQFIEILPVTLNDAVLSVAPLFALFVISQITILKMPPVQMRRVIAGFIYSFVGLILFLLGVNGGFMEAGSLMGKHLGMAAVTNGGAWTFILIATGFVLGAVVVCAEPSVWVLTDQVEQISGGAIKRRIMLLFLAGGSATSIALSMVRAVYGFNLLYALIPGYAIAVFLTLVCPPLFTGIAFDSGGVASGVITTTFILSFTLGAASVNISGNTTPFGVVALVAMIPLIAIQVLGLIFSKKQKN